MPKILEDLHDEYCQFKEICATEKHRISCTRGNLRKSLNKRQRKLLLRILDDYDLSLEKTSVSSFTEGARVGAQFILELLYDKPLQEEEF